MAAYVGAELAAKLDNPLVFQWQATRKVPSAIVYGYDVTILIDICNSQLSRKPSQSGSIPGASTKNQRRKPPPDRVHRGVVWGGTPASGMPGNRLVEF